MKMTYFSSLISFALMVCSAISVPAQQPVRHIVVFKYKAKATPDQIAKVTTAFKDLKNKIPGILSIETGENNSPEKLNKGFTHIYLVSFKNLAARDTYLPHPAHEQFKAMLGELGILDEPFVVDFEVNK